MRNFTKLSLYTALLCGTIPALAQTDITSTAGLLTAQYANADAAENFPKLIDNNTSTKYYKDRTSLWIQFEATRSAVVNQYSLTSANDFATRDPKSWNLQGSNDGKTWTSLDVQTNQTFATRFLTKTYSFTNTTSYLFYRLNITANNGANAIQFSEWKLTGSFPATPSRPTNVSVTVLPGYKASVSWSDNATNETNYRIESSLDAITFISRGTVGANVTSFTDTALSAATSLVYRVRAVNAAGFSIADTSAAIKTGAAPGGFDLTNYQNARFNDPYNTTGAEGLAKVTDNNIYSKYLAWNPVTAIGASFPGGAVATQYSITAANDAADRDPKDWAFQGSNDSTNWVNLQVQTNQLFTTRFKKRTYVFPNTTSYQYYRLNITANNGAGITQLAELEITGTGNGVINNGIPAAPTGFTTQAVSGNQIQLDWQDNTSTETNYRLERTTDTLNWNTSFELAPNTTHFYSLNLSPLTRYYYRLRAENANGASAWVTGSNTTLTAAPRVPWQEHWHNHVESLSLNYSNSSVNIYFDAAVDPSISWMNQDFTQVWEYVKQNYGSFSDPKLNMVFHGKPGYSGGHPATVFDSDHDFTNAGDLGGSWAAREGWNLHASIHEVGHIVEGGGKGVHHSPSFPIWGDSKWCEIFIYDVMKRLGWEADAQQAYNDFIVKSEGFPRHDTYWFRDWFMPIYEKGDSSAALNRYFQLLSEYFPQHNGGYTRDLNLGEFVHFWSGAVQFSLEQQADTAFGWDKELEMQFRQAQIDFPFTYPQPLLARTVAAVAEKKAAVLNIWPNPASQTLNLSLPDAAQVYAVDIYNIGGVKRLSQRIRGNYNQLDISSLPDGVYILTVTDNNQIIHKQKFVVNNTTSR
ncbi:T9SS type A sorting domain-containing protein [Chitinophaga rhizophila]|uniref:T9SS type A sorting domain-containing protein n=1 Tax=Chitinophaga rhizophila TaxID=2866212 RepID=A0ABS7GDF4_9BACT|nr:T9SS type A sorting domain-containing protein [Chitinophaga rhizophila]MBW8685707.1 T9SS type A sorting domain-containing protein [Chitinophaga rhizophila]